MYCPQCRATIEEHFKFCSKCGSPLPEPAAAATPPANPAKMGTHVNVLGWLLIASGVLTGLIGFVVVVIGGFLPQLPIEWPPDVPFNLARFAGIATVGVGILLTVVAVVTFMAGYGLLNHKPWARIAAIVVAVFTVWKFPLGTALAIYTFWVLLSEPGREYYKAKAEPVHS